MTPDPNTITTNHIGDRDIIIALKRKDNINKFDIDVNYDGFNVKKLALRWKESSSAEFDAIWQLRQIEVLTFDHFPYKYFPDSSRIGIGKFAETLKELTLEDCYNLHELPSEIELLVNLTSLTISYSQLTCLPHEIGNLVNLQILELISNTILQNIPKEIGHLDNLKILTMSDNQSLRSVPPEIFDLRSLLELEWSGIDDLPLEVCRLEYLQKLKIEWCKNLEHFPPNITKLKNLLKLEILRCHNLEDLPREIGNFDRLEEFEISWCENVSYLPPELGDLKSLKRLDIFDCPKIADLPVTICNLENLQELIFDSCDALAHFPSESSIWEHLRKFHIADTRDEVGNMEDIMLRCINFENLQELNIELCRSLRHLPREIGNLKCLRILNIWQCNHLEDLPPGIGDLECLEKMTIRSERLKYLPPEIGKLKNLRHLEITKARSYSFSEGGPFQFIPLEVGNLENLQVFEVSYCGCLERLSTVINKLKKPLQDLNIEYDGRRCEHDDAASSDVVFNGAFTMTLEKLMFYHCNNEDLDDFMERIISADQSSSELSFLLSQRIGSITFDFDEFQDGNRNIKSEVLFKLLQKYAKIGKIFFGYWDSLDYFTPDSLYMIYFNRFGRSLKPDDATSSKLPMLLEETKTKIHQIMDESNGKKQFCSEMISASVIYSILRKLALPVLLDRAHH